MNPIHRHRLSNKYKLQTGMKVLKFSTSIPVFNNASPLSFVMIDLICCISTLCNLTCLSKSFVLRSIFPISFIIINNYQTG